MRVASWVVREPQKPMVLEEREERPGRGEVLVEVAGCGVCHTDLGFYYEGVPTRHALPLALGHEISGTVVEVGPGAEGWLGSRVVVPAVIPCGTCAACESGHGAICPRQVFPGNDEHGGFGTHVRVPALGLCPVGDLADRRVNPSGLRLHELAVIADAVSTPYQAVVRSGLTAGDLAVFVGVGGVGGFGVQIAAALGAATVAVDVDARKLERLALYGPALSLRADQDFKELRRQLQSFAEARDIPTWRWRIFETSGNPAGQGTAFGLLGKGSYLSVVGYTPEKVSLRFSNLMALDAVAQGNWGCLPEHYPAVVDLALSGRVKVAPFVETRPLDSINDTFAALHERRIDRRVILTPKHMAAQRAASGATS